MTSNISFKANFINSQKIKRFTNPNKKIRTAFVELNPNSFNDRESVLNRSMNWRNGKTFASDIYEKLEDERFDETGRKFFALTLQQNNFEKLIPEKILGLTEIIIGNARNIIKIKHIQTDPEQKIDAPNRKFKGIGTAMLKSIKECYPKFDITLEAVDNESVINFYKANGFKMNKVCDQIIMEFIR